MRYLHVISAFAAEVWAMQPEKLEAVTSFLVFQAKGGKLSADEVEARIGDRRGAEVVPSRSGVAVLPMYGVISQRAGLMQDISGGTSTDALAAQFRAALADDQVSAIVFDVDSPGGGTYGVDELAAEIRAARGIKPIVAQVNSLCASAAYYLASQADEVVMTPGGEAGSIGVYAVHQDVSKMLAADGVKPTIIKAGKFKAETNSFEPLSDGARDYMQGRVDQAYGAFVSAVAAGRRVTAATVKDSFGQGRMFGAQEAVRRGMADRVGTMQDTLQRLGAATPRVGAAAAARQAFAAGGNPALSQIEEVLREAGFPNALATAFVSAGKGVLRSESGREETPTLSPDTKARLSAFLASQT